MVDARLAALGTDARLYLPPHGAPESDPAALARQAAELSARHPDDVALAAHAASAAVNVYLFPLPRRGGPESHATPAYRAAALTAIARAEAMDAGNGLYPLLRCACLVDAAVESRTTAYVESRTGLAYPTIRGIDPERIEPYPCHRLNPPDPAALAAARVALRAAADSPRFETYVADLRRRAADAVGPSDGVDGLALRAAADAWADDDWRVLYLAARNAYLPLIVAAFGEAEDGHAADALALAADVHRLAAVLLVQQPGSRAAQLLDQDYARDVVGQTACLLRVLGQVSAADRLEASSLKSQLAIAGARNAQSVPDRDTLRETGVLGQRLYFASTSPDTAAYAPLRSAELHVMDRAAVATALLVFGSIALAAAAVARPGGSGRTVLLLPPVRELLMLTTVGGAAGALAYAAWVGAFGRGVGSHGNSGDLHLSGYSAAGLAVLVTLLVGATAAGRRRLATLGVPVSAGRAYGATGGVAAAALGVWAAAIVYGCVWTEGPDLIGTGFLLLAGGVVALVFLRIVRLTRRGDGGPVRGVGTLLRSVALRLALAAILLSVPAVVPLYAAERTYVAAFVRASSSSRPSASAAPADLPGQAARLAVMLQELAGGRAAVDVPRSTSPASQ